MADIRDVAKRLLVSALSLLPIGIGAGAFLGGADEAAAQEKRLDGNQETVLRKIAETKGKVQQYKINLTGDYTAERTRAEALQTALNAVNSERTAADNAVSQADKDSKDARKKERDEVKKRQEAAKKNVERNKEQAVWRNELRAGLDAIYASAEATSDALSLSAQSSIRGAVRAFLI